MRGAVVRALLSVVALAATGSLTPALAQDGRSLFERLECGGCHGAEGARPVLPMYPNLAGQDAAYAFNQMKALRDGDRKNGLSITVRGVLVPLSDEELRALADYLASVTPGEASLEEAELLGRFGTWNQAVVDGGLEAVDALPFDPELAEGGDFRSGPVNKNALSGDAIFYEPDAPATGGQATTPYVTKGCIGCHGVYGKSPIPGYPHVAGQSARYSLRQMLDIQSGARRGGQSAPMRASLRAVSEDELRAIAAYLETLAR